MPNTQKIAHQCFLKKDLDQRGEMWKEKVKMESLLLCCCCCYVPSVVSNSVQPHRQKPTRLPPPWDSPGKNTGGGCHFLLQCMKVKSESEVTQSCLTLRNPMDCSLPGSSAHGIFQARVLEWGAIAFSHYCSESSKMKLEAIKEVWLNAQFVRMEPNIWPDEVFQNTCQKLKILIRTLS